MGQLNWETLYGNLGFQYNLLLLGQKEGTIFTTPTHIIAIVFPNRNDSKLKGFDPEEVDAAKDWVIQQVKQFYCEALLLINEFPLTSGICEAPGLGLESGDSL